MTKKWLFYILGSNYFGVVGIHMCQAVKNMCPNMILGNRQPHQGMELPLSVTFT